MVAKREISPNDEFISAIGRILKSIEIRKAQFADLDTIARIEQVCFPPEEAASRVAFEKRLQAFPDSFLVATLEDSGEIIGFINACVTDSKVVRDDMFEDVTQHMSSGDYHAILSVAVLPEHRGKGVAQALMRELIALTRTQGKKGLCLTCHDHLIEFYIDFGFENSGVSESKHGGSVWYDMILEF